MVKHCFNKNKLTMSGLIKCEPDEPLSPSPRPSYNIKIENEEEDEIDRQQNNEDENSKTEIPDGVIKISLNNSNTNTNTTTTTTTIPKFSRNSDFLKAQGCYMGKFSLKKPLTASERKRKSRLKMSLEQKEITKIRERQRKQEIKKRNESEKRRNEIIEVTVVDHRSEPEEEPLYDPPHHHPSYNVKIENQNEIDLQDSKNEDDDDDNSKTEIPGGIINIALNNNNMNTATTASPVMMIPNFSRNSDFFSAQGCFMGKFSLRKPMTASERKRKSRLKMSLEQKELMKIKERQRKQDTKNNESEGRRNERLAVDSVRQRERRKNLAENVLNNIREQDRLKHRIRRANLDEEQRIEIREKDRLKHQFIRSNYSEIEKLQQAEIRRQRYLERQNRLATPVFFNYTSEDDYTS